MHQERIVAKTRGQVGTDFMNYHKFISGLVACDGLDRSISHESVMVIWFLNMASAYRDMHVEGLLDKFNYEHHTAATYWLLGCRGPFGIINLQERAEHTCYMQYRLHKDVTPRQRDGHNCGVIWCLFVYDMMLQASVSYKNIMATGTVVLPVKFGIGKTWLYPDNYTRIIEHRKIQSDPVYTSNHLKVMCRQFRTELVALLERLRLKRLQNFNRDTEEPAG